MMNPLSYAVSKLGRWNPRINSLNMLLTAGDLPGKGWRILDERTWIFGEFPYRKEGEITDRAVTDGGVIAWRSFMKREPYSGFWVTIFPYASEQDAEAAIPDNSSQFSKNQAFRGDVGEERKVGGYTLPEIEHATFFEHSVSGGRGHAMVRFVSGNVQNVVFVIASSVLGEGVPWEDMISIASKEVGKIDKIFPKTQ